MAYKCSTALPAAVASEVEVLRDDFHNTAYNEAAVHEHAMGYLHCLLDLGMITDTDHQLLLAYIVS